MSDLKPWPEEWMPIADKLGDVFDFFKARGYEGIFAAATQDETIPYEDRDVWAQTAGAENVLLLNLVGRIIGCENFDQMIQVFEYGLAMAQRGKLMQEVEKEHGQN